MAFTITKDLMLPSTVTGSWPRPRWFDMSMWAKPLDTCMMDVRFREKFQDALSVVISDEERAGLDILTHGDVHCDEDFAGRSWHHYPSRLGRLRGRLSPIGGNLRSGSSTHPARCSTKSTRAGAGRMSPTRSSIVHWITLRFGGWPRPKLASPFASAPAARRSWACFSTSTPPSTRTTTKLSGTWPWP